MRTSSAGCEKYHKGRRVQLNPPLPGIGSQGGVRTQDLTARVGRRLTHPPKPASLTAIMLLAAHHHHVHHHGPTGLGERMCVAGSC